MKALLKDRSAHQDHQNLIDRNARTFIHRIHVIEKAYDVLLIEEGDRTENRAAQRILDQRAEFLVGIQCSRRAQEWVLLSPVHGISDEITNRLPQDVLLRHAADLLSHWLRADHFHDMMIEKRQSPLYGMRHLHAIAQHCQNVAREQSF